jgi:hypothetical protein
VRGTFVDLLPGGASALSFNIVEGNRDTLITPLDGKMPPTVFARSAANETQPALSPDGKWLAEAFPGGGRKIPGGRAAANAPVTILINWQTVAARGVRPAAVGAR